MNKIIKYLTLSIVTSTIFLSCSADASQGMLRSIVTSKAKTSYTIKKSSINALDNYFVSVENDGIYRESPSTNPNDSASVVREKYINSENFRSVQSIYTLDYDSYFIYIKIDENKNTIPTLMYFNNNNAATTYEKVTLNTTTEIPLNITSNGYLITKKDATSYSIYKLGNSTNKATLVKSFVLASGEEYVNYATFDTDKFVITTTKTTDNKATSYYYYFDVSAPADDKKAFTITTDAKDKNSSIVSVIGEPTSAMILTANGYAYSGDISNGGNITTKIYSNTSDIYTFASNVPTINIDDTNLLAMNSNKFLFVYDKAKANRYNTYSDVVMPYAKDLNNSSPIVYIYEKSSFSGVTNYWIATETSGFFTIAIDTDNIITTSTENKSAAGLQNW